MRILDVGCGERKKKIPDAEVMCPFCLNRMKLKEARIPGQ